MDDLLYALFVVAWIAYGIYKGVKKNDQAKKKTIPAQEANDDHPEQSKVESAIESVFNEVFDLPPSKNDKISHFNFEENIEKQAEKAPLYENYARNEVLDSYKGTDNVISVFEEESNDPGIGGDSNKIFDNQVEELNDDERNTVFDLRQAVIHQVILQRPY